MLSKEMTAETEDQEKNWQIAHHVITRIFEQPRLLKYQVHRIHNDYWKSAY